MKIILAFLIIAVVVVAGCTSTTQSGVKTLPDGSIQKADGTIVKPNGVMVKPDGTMIAPEGSPAGTIVKEDGTVVKPDGTMIKPDRTMVKPDGTMVKPDGTMILPNGTMIEPENKTIGTSSSASPYSGAVLAGTSAKVLDFKKADYDAVLQNGKVILLYFYADWCPICRQEVPEMYAAFNELSTDKIIAFRVNFNDGSTDADERALAEKFGVPYQHTKVILKDGKAVLKSPESWTKSRYLSEINKILG